MLLEEEPVSKKGRVATALLAVALIAAVAGYFVWSARVGTPEVETARVAKRDLAVTVTAQGTVRAGARADVYPPVQGVLDEVLVNDGQVVEAGQELAKLDATPLELQVAQARAGLSQAKAQRAAIDDQAAGPADLSAAREGVTAARKAHDAAKAQAAAVGTQAPTTAQKAAARAATTAAKGAYDNAFVAWSAYPSQDTTKAALAAVKDHAYAGYLSAKATEEQLASADLSAARAQAQAGEAQAFAAVKAAEAQLKKLEGANVAAQRLAADAAVDQAATALTLAERNFADATLVAPIGGVVVFNTMPATVPGVTVPPLGPGSAVTPGSPPFTLVDLDALSFVAEVDEVDVRRVALGKEATISLDSVSDKKFATTITRINPVAQATATGSTIFEVELALEAPGENILIGMKGDAVIEVSSQPDALTIPKDAFFSEGGTDYVYVIENGKLRKTEITVGAETETVVEVLDGIEENMTVALAGAAQYTDGMAVRTADGG